MKSSTRKTQQHSTTSTQPSRPRDSTYGTSHTRRRASLANLLAPSAVGISTIGEGGGGLVGAAMHRQEFRLFDEEGRDVTPQPLLPAPKAIKQVGGSAVTQSGEQLTNASQSGLGGSTRVVPSSVLDYFASLEAQTLHHFSSVNFGKSFASFGGSRVSTVSMSEAPSEDETASMTSERSVEDDDHGRGANSAYTKPGLGSPKKRRDTAHGNAPSAGEPSESDLNRTLHITLTESETFTLLELPSTSVAPDDSELTAVELANEQYAEVLASRASSNNLTHRAIQTYNAPTKTKDIQAVLVKGVSAEVQVNEWSIFDDWSAREPAEVTVDANLNSFAKGSVSNEAIPSMSSGGVSGTTAGMGGNLLESSSFISTTLSNMDASQTVVAGAAAEGSSIFGNPSGPHGNSEMVVPAYLEREVTLQSISQPRLKESLRIMESAVLESVYAPRLLEYRDFSSPLMPHTGMDVVPSTAAEAFEANIPSLQYLWSFRCDLVRDRCVMAMAWNKSNPDVLAVGYGPSRNVPGPPASANGGPSGPTATSSASQGLICCWSLKNPEYPQRVFRTSSCVTAIDFSRASPNLLAVGFMDGRIALYDVRHDPNNPTTHRGPSAGGSAHGSGAPTDEDMGGALCIDSSALACKHRDPVWQVRWVDKEQSIGDHHSRAESVVSVSTDGRVCQWLLRKGLGGSDLMTLKAVKAPEAKRGHNAAGGSQSVGKGGAGGAGKGGAGATSTAGAGAAAGVANGRSSFISRSAGGLGFDFHPTDHNTYLVATEDGSVHKCSVSYNEQYLTNYYGHAGPVYRVKWSPFSPNVFATCSADWSVGLWHQDSEKMGLKFYSGKDAIMDLDWCPHSPTVLASVSLDGRIEVWDLSQSVLDPTVVHSVLDQRLMCCLFGLDTPILVTGDDAGSVNVYKLRRMHLLKVHPRDRDAVSKEQLDAVMASASSMTSVLDMVKERTAMLESLVLTSKQTPVGMAEGGSGAVMHHGATGSEGVKGGVGGNRGDGNGAPAV